MSLKNRLTAPLLALVLASAFSSCGDDEPDSDVASDCTPAHPDIETISSGTLTVVGFDSPPFSTIEGDSMVGVDGDILKEIAALECLDLKVSPLAPAAIIPAIQANQADLAAGGIYRTAERNEIVGLSDPMYLDQMGIISADGVSDIPDLQGRKVGTVDGYFWVADMKEYLGDDLKTYATPANMYADIQTGRIDVAIDSFGSGVVLGEGLEVRVATPFEEVAASTEGFQTTFPIPKDNTSLLEAVNDNIAELHESGRLAEILTENGLDASAGDTGEPQLIG